MLIQEFCRVTGLSRDTVRFYEKRGLLTPMVGAGGGNRYRVFDDAQVERARLIRAAQRLGFTLREIAALAVEYEREGLSAEARARVLRDHLAALDTQAERLHALRSYLRSKLEWLEAGEGGPAPRLELDGEYDSAADPGPVVPAVATRDRAPVSKRSRYSHGGEPV